MKLYVDTVRPIVKSVDDTRTFLTSSPSNDLEDIITNANSLNGDGTYTLIYFNIIHNIYLNFSCVQNILLV